jgi:hypothetical protein
MAERELNTEIEIDATAEKIWHILTEFEKFPQWNPFIRRISGELKVGARLEVHMQLPGGRSMTFKPRVLKVEPNREFRWKGKLLIPGLFDGEHIFTVDPLSEKRVRFIQREVMAGMLVPLFFRGMDKTTRRGFEEMNQVLKSMAERTSSK